MIIDPEELRGVLARELARHVWKSARRLLSKREAIRLGIDRGTTLQDLIRSGSPRTVVLRNG